MVILGWTVVAARLSASVTTAPSAGAGSDKTTLPTTLFPPATLDGVSVRDWTPMRGPCVTVWVLPATVSVPVRAVVSGLAATVKLTVFVPEPLAPELTTIQGALLLAVQEHDAPVATLTLPAPPAAVNVCTAGETAGAQD
jgi:hypothetical protein